jgi:hypothetical protein
MPFTGTTFYGPGTIVSESCLWLSDGTRRICITYEYQTALGVLKYAASVFRCHTHREESVEPTTDQMAGNEHTTTCRFEMRPVIFQTTPGLDYHEILSTIRHEMCHGYGCKGPRFTKRFWTDDTTSGVGFDTESTTSTDNSFLSDYQSDDYCQDVSAEAFDKLQNKTPRQLRFISDASVENYFGDRLEICREFFIVFKANKRTGDLLYGAAISRRPVYMGLLDDDLRDAHYKTALARLEKCPVYMEVSADTLPQLKKNAPHREDLMYEILDYINDKHGGQFQIRDTIRVPTKPSDLNAHARSFTQQY